MGTTKTKEKGTILRNASNGNGYKRFLIIIGSIWIRSIKYDEINGT